MVRRGTYIAPSPRRYSAHPSPPNSRNTAPLMTREYTIMENASVRMAKNIFVVRTLTSPITVAKRVEANTPDAKYGSKDSTGENRIRNAPVYAATPKYVAWPSENDP